MSDLVSMLGPIRRLHEQIRDRVVAECERASLEELSGIAADEEGDTIFAVDRVAESTIIEFFEREVAPTQSLVLIAEGLPGGITLPRGIPESEARWRIIVDPIDGTRGLMYQKRSAWVLTGVAPNRGDETNLSDIELAVQTEIPLVKQHLSDTIWAVKGSGILAERVNRLTGETNGLKLHPSRSLTIAQSFSTVVRFFPGVRDELAAIDDEIVTAAMGPIRPAKAHCFEDQYLSSGGQLYELIAGHDRFIADLRPLMGPVLERRGLPLGLCCHPYDLCTELIAREAGVIVTDPSGKPMAARLNLEADVAWVGYANAQIRQTMEPLLQNALRRRGLL
jgi:fructose-1,6-bisphosphatase/inositol monophosphatase family enzyme